MEIKKLIEWNPWWENKDSIKELKKIPRREYKSLVESVEIKEITILIGVRRSGKSTLMYQMVDFLLSKGIKPEQIFFMNLEDRQLLNDSLEDIYSAYKENINPREKSYIFIDEIHRKERWESWIRKKYDLGHECKFVISGSCSYLLKKEYSTLLTGRNLTFEVFPLSFEEFLLFKGMNLDKEKLKKGIVTDKTRYEILNYLKEFIEFGGFPEIFFSKENYKMKILKQYFDDILYKDIIDRYNINGQKARDLALFLITNFTSNISLRNIRHSLGLSYDLIKDYIHYYTESFLFFVVEHFSYSLKEQKTRASKIYCIDNGLRNSVSFKFSKDEGKLVENIVFVELKRREKEVYYWKDKGEVDFVIKDKNVLIGINVSYSNDIDKREINSLLEFKDKFRERAGKLIIITKNLEKKEGRINYIPLWKWILSD